MSSSSRSSSPSIEEIVEKLRSIRETSPELYKEAWNKIPHKTKIAIEQFEASEKSDHHHQRKTLHEAGSTPTHSSHDSLHASKFQEEHHSNPQTRHAARDWEAPAQTPEHHSHPHQPSTPHHDKQANHPLNSPTLTATEDSHKTETAKSKALASARNPEETEKALRKSVSAHIPKAHQIMKQAANEKHLPTSLQEVLLATTVYELELIRIGLDKLARRLDNQQRSSMN